MILSDIYERNARLWPRRTAYECDGRRITNAEFLARLNRLANAMAGIERQERVAILASNRIEYVEVQAACERAGFIAVGINTRLAEPEIAAILADCLPCALFFESKYANLADQLRVKRPEIRRLVAMGGAPAWAEAYEDLLAAASDATPRARAVPTDVAHLIYTSGTTGRAKGVMLSHAALLQGAQMTAHDGGALPTDRILLVMPLFHIGAKIEQLAFSLAGATILFHGSFDTSAVLRAIQSERVSALHLAATLLTRLMNDPQFGQVDLSAVRCVHYSASPIALPLLRKALAAFGPVLVQIYGMTECPVGTILKPHQHVADGDELQTARLASTGQEFFKTQVRVVGPDGSDCAQGEIGEILISSPASFDGYWQSPEATQEALRDGWLHTGDMGFQDAERFLFLADRKKDMIISGGENIYSREVEDVLRQHPAVADAAVIGVPDEQWGEVAKAYIVLNADSADCEASLIQHCKTLLARYKCPRSFEFVKEIPRTPPLGKIDKKALRAPHWKGRTRFIS